METTPGKFSGEKVLVIPNDVLRKILKGTGGFFPASDLSSPVRMVPFAKYIDREHAECDESTRQLIPYVLISRNIEGETEYFLFKRLDTQGEKRLHNLYSLGAGGHINPVDNETGDPLEAGLMRELNEELFLPSTFHLDFKGWIYSSIDPVSMVHAGMVYVMEIISGDVKIRENDKMTGSWHGTEELMKYYDSMEGWSRIVMDYLINP